MKTRSILKKPTVKINQLLLKIIFAMSLFTFQITFAQTKKSDLPDNEQESILKNPIEISLTDLIQVDSTKKEKAKYKVKISGVLQVHYLNEFNTNGDTIRDPDGFRILRARLIASGKVSKNISYQLMIDPRSPELGGMLRDAYAEFHYIKNQKIRVGQQKTQFGWENRQSITKLYVVNRSEMADNVSRGENLRDIGIGILGYIPINKNLRFENAVTFTNGTRSNVRGPYDFNTKKALWGRFGLSYKKKEFETSIGGSFGLGGLRYLGDDIVDPADDIYANFNRVGVDAEFNNKHFFLVGEYGMGTDRVSDTIYSEPFGYSVLLAIKTRWKAGPMIRYDVFEDEFKRITFGAFYGLPNEKLRFLINYEYRGLYTDVPNGHDDRLYIQMQIVF